MSRNFGGYIRESYGNRIWSARFDQHNGNVDEHGQPTYKVDTDWVPVLYGYMCELMTVSGGEGLRGRQVQAEASHVLFGDYMAVVDVDTAMRVEISNVQAKPITYNVVAVYDPDGRNRTMRVELKRQV